MAGDARPEAPGVDSRVVIKAALGFLAFVAVSLAALGGYYAWIIREPVLLPPRTFGEPQLQSNPRADLTELRAAQASRLHGYAWVDRGRGLARIPIEQAMALIAARGDQAYAPLDQLPSAPPGRQP